MPSKQIAGTTAVVTGASRGLGRAVAAALYQAGAHVVGVARDAQRLDEVRQQLGEAFTGIAADAADPVVAGEVIDAYRPAVLILAAGARPLPRPVQQHTWQTFSRNWEVDVQQVFHWTREALLAPLHPGSVVVPFSSGAAVGGSPLSGGYAGAKAAIRFITSYAADESVRAGLGIRFVSVLPNLIPATDLGAAAAIAYARRQSIDTASFVASRGPLLDAEQMGTMVLDLIVGSQYDKRAYLVTPGGLAGLN
jgi:NAD(P)-dependent dehydrogenase (short-subunit alcohol dehydrogenase family)